MNVSLCMTFVGTKLNPLIIFPCYFVISLLWMWSYHFFIEYIFTSDFFKTILSIHENEQFFQNIKTKKIIFMLLSWNKMTVILLKLFFTSHFCPVFSYMYWTDWILNRTARSTLSAKIERASMTGENRTVIVDTKIRWPNGLSLDFKTNRLYWCDSYYDTIESIELTATGAMASSRKVH